MPEKCYTHGCSAPATHRITLNWSGNTHPVCADHVPGHPPHHPELERQHASRLRGPRPRPPAPRMDDLVLVRSDHGDGGWSLHPPGSTDDEIREGGAPVLASGIAGWDDEMRWSRPSERDYLLAGAVLRVDDLPVRITAWREAEGLTQGQAAAMLGVGLRTLHGWERGDTIGLPVILSALLAEWGY